MMKTLIHQLQRMQKLTGKCFKNVSFSFFLLLLFPLVMFFALSCRKADDPTVLEINLKDSIGNALSGVTINLYTTLQDWGSEKNPLASQISDAGGKAIFTGLESVKYYWMAKSGCSNNAPNTYHLDTTLALHRTTTVHSSVVPTGTIRFENNTTDAFHLYKDNVYYTDIGGPARFLIVYEPVGDYTIRLVQITSNGTPKEAVLNGRIPSCGETAFTAYP